MLDLIRLTRLEDEAEMYLATSQNLSEARGQRQVVNHNPLITEAQSPTQLQ